MTCMTFCASFFCVGFRSVQNLKIDDGYTLSAVFSVSRGFQKGAKRAANFCLFRLFFRPGPQWVPRGAKEVPKGAQGGPKEIQGGPKRGPGRAKGDPKGVQGNPKGVQGKPRGTKKGSWGICSGHGGGEAAGNWIYIYPPHLG